MTITGAGGGLGERGVGVGEAVASVGAGGGVPGFFSGLDWTCKERGGGHVWERARGMLGGDFLSWRFCTSYLQFFSSVITLNSK